MSLSNFAPVLNQRWVAGNYVNQIVGQKEDGSHYTVEVPHDLRDIMIQLQNALVDRYDHAKNLQAQLERANAIVADFK